MDREKVQVRPAEGREPVSEQREEAGLSNDKSAGLSRGLGVGKATEQ